MEGHPYLQQKEFQKWLMKQGIHSTQFSPLGNQNSFYREVGWGKPETHLPRVIDHPVLREIADKYDKSPVQIALAWGVNSGRSVIPKSVIEWQIKENLEPDIELDAADMEKIGTMDIKVRFNDPSSDYQWCLYEGHDGK